MSIQAMTNQSSMVQSSVAMESDLNFSNRIRELVNRILTQLSRISETDRRQIESLKREYRNASHDSADTQRQIGNAAPLIAALSVACALSQFMVATPENRKLVQFVAEQVPSSIGGLYNNRLQAKQMEYQAVASLRSTEIQNKGQQNASESSSKQEVLALLNSTLEVLKRASSSN